MSFSAMFEDLNLSGRQERLDGLERFSDEQKEALLSPFSQSAVIYAGAGAGKTTVLVERVSRLLSKSAVNPASIAVITFTSKSAEELKKRLRTRFGPKAVLPYCGTVHALALKLLAQKGVSFSLISDEQQTELLLKIREAFSAESELVSLSDKELLLEISRAREESDYTGNFGIVAFFYEQLLAESNLMDFTSLLVDAAKEDWHCFDYILVDEAQDLSVLQQLLIDKLGSQRASFWFIGDDDQAIYAFRGAGAGNMKMLSAKTGRSFVLSTNYRSDRLIVQHALNVISFNKDRENIRWRANSTAEGLVGISSYLTGEEELEGAVAFLQNNTDAMVLGRTQALISELKAMRLPAMTVHESKGLEWSNVLIIGCESALFPHPLSLRDEERRLFYVAMTRAKHCLQMTYSTSRNSKNAPTRHPSPFLLEAQTLPS
jgi:DNA helicase-2/ATP-dependent DNA helicase PcrA